MRIMTNHTAACRSFFCVSYEVQYHPRLLPRFSPPTQLGYYACWRHHEPPKLKARNEREPFQPPNCVIHSWIPDICVVVGRWLFSAVGGWVGSPVGGWLGGRVWVFVVHFIHKSGSPVSGSHRASPSLTFATAQVLSEISNFWVKASVEKKKKKSKWPFATKFTLPASHMAVWPEWELQAAEPSKHTRPHKLMNLCTGGW